MSERRIPHESGETPLPDSKGERRKEPQLIDVPLEEIGAGFRYGEGDIIADKYRLTRSLGQGGMGEVWKAHNQILEVDVALKLLRHDVDNPGAADRLLREARAAARLGHPAIVRVFDFGTAEGGEPFIVMELLEGEDLSSSLHRHGRMSATRAVRTMLPIIHALAAAHAKDIVHRDIKPENIFLARIEGEHLQPKIVDFGIAQLDHKSKGTSRLTGTGTLLGTPSYMSPEQARGEATDYRADIWSVCVVLYEMMTGRLPFEGKNPNALLYAILMSEAPPIMTFDVGDQDLWDILSRGLTKNPDERHHSMQSLGEALAGWLLAKNVNDDISGASIGATWVRGPVHRSSAPPPPLLESPSLPSGVRDATTMHLRAPPTRKRAAMVVAAGVVLLVGVTLLALGRGSAGEASVGSGASDAPSSVTSVPTTPQAASASSPGAAAETAGEPPPAPSASTAPSSGVAARGPTKAPTRRTSVVAPKKPRRVLKDPFHP